MTGKLWLLLSTLLSAGVVTSSSDAQKNISAEPGDDVTLTCEDPNNDPIIVVKWNRTDLKDKYVLLYRDKQLDPEKQHQSYKNRVDLQMKDGNVSLILRNVTTDDEGRYECEIVQRRRNSEKIRSSEFIYLEVLSAATPGGGKKDGNSRGHVGLGAGLIVFGLIVAVGVGIMISKRHTKKKSQPPPPPPPDEEADLQQTLVL